MPQLTIGIPSIFPDKLDKCINSIITHTANIDYEIIVCGTPEVELVVSKYPNTKFILDKERIPVLGNQRILENSLGEYYILLNDDCVVTENWARNMLDFLAQYKNERYVCGVFRIYSEPGREIQPFALDIGLYPTFFCMKTSELKELGGFDRGYKMWFIDPDIGMRIWKNGGKVLLCPNSIIYHEQEINENRKERMSKYWEQDEKKFESYWGYKLRYRNENNNKCNIIFCLPGNSFSGRFLDCWSNLLTYCMTKGIKFAVSRRESCNIYYVRNMCLGADVSRGENQKPFNGDIDYDYLMWIDSDMVFNPQQFERLLSHNKDIVSGLYLMDSGKQFATVKDWDEEFFKKNGYFQFMTMEDIKGRKELMEVSYTGFGFMLIKKGVFESMTYPWFKPIEKRIGNMVDFCMEDVAFCLRAKENGYKIYIDPLIKVGHEKKIVY